MKSFDVTRQEIATPKTGHLAPVDAAKTKWCVECYRCECKSQGTRTQAIKRHLQHKKECR